MEARWRCGGWQSRAAQACPEDSSIRRDTSGAPAGEAETGLEAQQELGSTIEEIVGGQDSQAIAEGCSLLIAETSVRAFPTEQLDKCSNEVALKRTGGIPRVRPEEAPCLEGFARCSLLQRPQGNGVAD